MMADNKVQAVVIDNGSGFIKAGISGNEAPKCIFHTIIIPPQFNKGIKVRDAIIGELAHYRVNLNQIYPIQRGIITNWENMEKIWHHIFYSQLRVAPEEHPVVLTEALMNPKANRERMVQVMFETFGIPSVSVMTQAVLALFAAGRVSGVVLDSGYCMTSAVPILEGYVVPHAIQDVDFGGNDLTRYLIRISGERGYDFDTAAGREMIRDIKEKLCYVALDFEDEMEKARASYELERSYEMICGNVYVFNNERFRCPEALFKLSLIGKGELGIHDVLVRAIQKCEVHVREELYANIVLAGGNTMFKGIEQRLELETSSLAPANIKVKVVAYSDRKVSAWIGGSVIAELPTFAKLSVSKEEYEESGPSVLHRKFKFA